MRWRRQSMDITNPRVLYVKGGLFLVAGTLAAAGILLEQPSVKVAALLVITVWCFARAYYFAFYVVQHYADSSYRFAGLWSFVRYVVRRNLKQQPTQESALHGEQNHQRS